MPSLPVALEAEVRADFRRAILEYEGLADQGSALDRIGICQALARCHEKLGQLAEAAPWRRKAAQGYMTLTDEEMPRDERRYYALVEARNAVQDLAAHPEALKEAEGEYRQILADNWKSGSEGLTHEGLFGAFFFWRQGDFASAMKYFFDVAEAVNEQATEASDATLRSLSIRVYELAEDAARKADRADVANVAAKRSFALRGGPRPQLLGGL